MLKKPLLLAVGLALIGTARRAHAEDSPSKGPDPAATRALSLREQNNVSGTTGLLHLTAPASGAENTFRVSVLGDGYSGSGFLCTATKPCDDSSHDSASHFGTTFGLSVTPVSFFEAYGSLRSFANGDDEHSPGLLDVLGNSALGVKFFTPAPLGVLELGGSAELDLLSGSGSVGFNGKSTSGHLTALGALDFRSLADGGAPLRVLANVGYFLDNSGTLVEKVEQARGTPITRVERFGLGINRVDQVQFGLGVEAFIDTVRPFVEWNLGVPFNRQRYTCLDHAPFTGDGCLGKDHTFSTFPSALTVGARTTPWLPGLTGTVAVDIGTSGTSNFIEELAPTLPWDLWFGVAYAFDAAPPPPPKVVVAPPKVLPPPVKVELRARGLVHEKDKQEGIAHAIVKYRGLEHTAMATGDDGRFVTDALPPGAYTFDVTADGYKPGECSVTLNEPTGAGAAPAAPSAKPVDPLAMPADPTTAKPAPGAKPADPDAKGAGESDAPPPAPAAPGDAAPTSLFDVDCELEALPRTGTVTGHVVDAETGAPVGGASVELSDSLHRSLDLTTDATGSFHFERVVPGSSSLKAEAPDFLFHTQTFELASREDARVEISLHKRPKVSLVQLTPNELKIKQQVHFEKDSATILDDSSSLLEQVADTLARTPSIAHVEIQGHTDDSGTPDHNKSLSEARANAVLEWLVAHGIDSARLSARGYGQERPISPNVSPQGRARNRRVQFIISH
ncbi:MAG TPA: carboxypeptidase regulatory-like domain-containing protein [Polyangiaceae bacterium]|nr:carboxypeptidase regulatory-like domain-containing protein [Polyangiaceae bacterium]